MLRNRRGKQKKEKEEKEELLGRTESSDEEEDDSSESEEEDEQEREERMRLARTHAMLSRELERACATLGVVEDGATTNRETLGLYGEYGASLGTAAGLVRSVARNRARRNMVLYACMAYFAFCVVFVLWCRFPIHIL